MLIYNYKIPNRKTKNAITKSPNLKRQSHSQNAKFPSIINNESEFKKGELKNE